MVTTLSIFPGKFAGIKTVKRHEIQLITDENGIREPVLVLQLQVVAAGIRRYRTSDAAHNDPAWSRNPLLGGSDLPHWYDRQLIKDVGSNSQKDAKEKTTQLGGGGLMQVDQRRVHAVVHLPTLFLFITHIH
jgi:hypothetical protein